MLKAKINGMLLYKGWQTEKPVTWEERESRWGPKSASRESALQ